MRGRQVFMESLLAHDVQFIFGNPGTTENAVIDGMIDYPDLTYIIALHEGVALGAATFYAQASGRTAVVNLHAAPGLGNAIGLLFGAVRANAPMVVTAGQQDTRMRLREPVLSDDLVAMAAPVTKWSAQVEHADEISLALRRAFKIAAAPPRGPVFLSLPMDVMEQETEIAAAGPGGTGRMGAADPAAIAEAAGLLAGARHPLIIAGDGVAQAGADGGLARLAEVAGAEIWFEPSRGRVPLDTTHGAVRGSLPFDTVATRGIFADADVIVLIGGRFFEELWFDPGGLFAPATKSIEIEESYPALAHSHAVSVGLIGDLDATTGALAEALGGAADKPSREAATERLARMKAAKAGAHRQSPPAEAASDRVSVALAMESLRAGLPADAVIVDESFSTRRELNQAFDFAGPGDFFAGRGGGIGQGLAGAIGVQLAYPERRVVAVSGDGSAMYAIQALWSAAHHDLPIIFVIMANGEYGVLKRNLDEWRRRFAMTSNRSNPHMDISRPRLDFVALAQGMGVGAVRVEQNADLAPALRDALDAKHPYLIELVI